MIADFRSQLAVDKIKIEEDGFAKDLDFIIDDSPLKQGLFSPGRFVPVIDSSVLNDPAHRPDYLVILAWNFAQPIIKKQQPYQQAGGRFIVPIPQLQIV